MARLEKQWAESAARWKEEEVVMHETNERNEKMFLGIMAELQEGRDERRALLEALFRVMDRLPPPPPDLRSA